MSGVRRVLPLVIRKNDYGITNPRVASCELTYISRVAFYFASCVLLRELRVARSRVAFYFASCELPVRELRFISRVASCPFASCHSVKYF